MSDAALPPPVDRVVRGFETMDLGTRRRHPGDAGDLGIPVAATVVLVRDGDAGVEVLLIERPDRGSFAGAWVFPGGKIEQADRRDADGETDAALRAAVRETVEETGLVLDPEDLVPLSMWDPPPGAALRIRTWFYLAPAPEGEITLQADEAVSHVWLDAAELLARHGRGELTLYPPTWVTLHGLLGAPSAESVLGAARLAGVRRFETVARRTDAGPQLLWLGDADYDGDAAAEASARHRLDIGALPWTYTRAE